MDAGKALGLDDYPYRYNCDAKGVVNSTFETTPGKPSINHTEENVSNRVYFRGLRRRTHP